MIKHIFLILAVFIFTLGGKATIAQNKEYIHLEGTIGTYPVSMELYKAYFEGEPVYSGTYYYHNQWKPISFYQDYDATNTQTKIVLRTDAAEETDSEIFNGQYDGNIYKGKWSKNGKTLDFKLTKSTALRTKSINKSEYFETASANGEEIYNFSLAYNWMVPEDDNITKGLIQLVTFNEYSTFDGYYKNEIETNKAFYDEVVKDMKAVKDPEDLRPINFEINNEVYPFMINEKYITYTANHYEFTGGARGNYTELFYNYDKALKKWLTLNDILDMSYEQRISKLFINQIKAKHKIPANKSIADADIGLSIENEIHISEYFIMNKNGITFYYMAGDINSYADGNYELFISYEQLLPYLNKNFQR